MALVDQRTYATRLAAGSKFLPRTETVIPGADGTSGTTGTEDKEPPLTSPQEGPFAYESQRHLTTVTNYGVPILIERVPYDNNSPEERAKRIANRLNDCFLNDLKLPRTETNLRQGYLADDSSGTKYVFFGYLHQGDKHETADIIATVDRGTAAQCKVKPIVLACWWRDIIRDWLLVDQGHAPKYTVVYTPVLKDFFNNLPPVGQGNQFARFRQAADALTNKNEEFERLRLLSIDVPPKYVAVPDDYVPNLADDGGPANSG